MIPKSLHLRNGESDALEYGQYFAERCAAVEEILYAAVEEVWNHHL